MKRLRRWIVGLLDYRITGIRLTVQEGDDEVDSIILTRADGKIAVVPSPRGINSDYRLNVHWQEPK